MAGRKSAKAVSTVEIWNPLAGVRDNIGIARNRVYDVWKKKSPFVNKSSAMETVSSPSLSFPSIVLGPILFNVSGPDRSSISFKDRKIGGKKKSRERNRNLTNLENAFLFLS